MDEMMVLRDAAWAAHAEMLNRAMDLEKAAKELRERAWKLYQVLDPVEAPPSVEALAMVVEWKK